MSTARRALALFLAFWLAGCSPALQPRGAAVGEPRLVQGAMIASDGATLPMRRWLPRDGEPRALIVALHGFNDYSNAFAAAGGWWAERGVATYAYDQRGFGQAGERGIWAGQETMVADMLDAVAAVRARHPGLPVYLLGESMGGAVLLTALAGRESLPDGVRGAILSAPAVWSRETMPFYQRWALGAVGLTMPGLTLRPPKGLKIRASDNIPMLRALGRDPLVIKGTRVDAMRGLTDLMDRAMAATDDLRVPALVMYGENEQLIPPDPVKRALGRLPETGPRVALYPQGWHLLLRDLQAETVWADVLAWIEDPAGPLPSGMDRNAKLAALRGQAVPSVAEGR
ncbi:MAG TPA: alpha/beta hydrolase [Azospirillaceae bacterium]|nr:alpha/beta hydrolase [Azospirillaceae bacterium]